MLKSSFPHLKKRALNSDIIFEFKTLEYNSTSNIQSFSIEDMTNIKHTRDLSMIPDIRTALIWVPGKTRIRMHDTDQDFSIDDEGSPGRDQNRRNIFCLKKKSVNVNGLFTSKIKMSMNGSGGNTSKGSLAPALALFAGTGIGAGMFSRSVQRMKMMNTRSNSSKSPRLSNPILEAEGQKGRRTSKLGMSLLNVIQQKLRENSGQDKMKEDAQQSGIFTVTDPIRIRQLKDGQEKAKE